MNWSNLRIIEDTHLTISTTIEVKRTWKERIFSLKPFQKTKIVICNEPDPNIYQLKNDVIVCHPSIANKIRLEMAEITRPDPDEDWFLDSDMGDR